jgi:hypothetical protein
MEGEVRWGPYFMHGEPDASADDLEKPLLGAVLCCTAVPPEQRVNLAALTLNACSLAKTRPPDSLR